MVSDTETIALYDRRAADYAAMTDDDNRDSAELKAFCALLPKGGRILDFGCGPGASAQAMADMGFIAEAMDASAEMVSLAAQKSGVIARQGRFDDLTAEARYDGIWANFSLLHAARTDLPRHLSACHRALVRGGVLSIGMKTGTGHERDELGRFYTYVTIPELTTLLEDAGFRPCGFDTGSAPGLSGVDAPWVVMRAYG